MYNIGQADNLLSAGSVSMPKYDNGSLVRDQYPCDYTLPDTRRPPPNIPLGSFNGGYDTQGYNEFQEPYVENTQQKTAGEWSDRELLIVMVILLVILCVCTYVSFNYI